MKAKFTFFVLTIILISSSVSLYAALADEFSTVSEQGYQCRLGDDELTSMGKSRKRSFKEVSKKAFRNWKTKRKHLKQQRRSESRKSGSKNAVKKLSKRIRKMQARIAFYKRCVIQKDLTLFPPPDPDIAKFSSFESAQIAPITLSADGSTLFMVNTEEGYLEVYDVQGDSPQYVESIPVGVEPVTVKKQGANRLWVVNHIGDSISIVDTNSRTTIKTVQTGDGPTDVAFAGNYACVTISNEHKLECFLQSDLDSAATEVPLKLTRPVEIQVNNSQFEIRGATSGNDTGVVGFDVVNAAIFIAAFPYATENPIPNGENGTWNPAMDSNLPTPPQTGIIVKKDRDSGEYRYSGFPGDWRIGMRNTAVNYELARVDVNSLAVLEHRGSELTATGAMLINETSGEPILFGQFAHNDESFEPTLKGRFIQVASARYPASGEAVLSDLNPHLNYSASQIEAQQNSESYSAALEAKSIGEVRDAVWNASATKIYAIGRGSNNLVLLNADGTRDTSVAPLELDAGPTGAVLDAAHDRLFILNQHGKSLSVIDTVTFTEEERVSLFNNVPGVIRAGRKLMFDTKHSSELGHVACGSCHLDLSLDRLAWNLGNPQGEMVTVQRQCAPAEEPGPCLLELHPMKGPMTTQTLIGRRTDKPMHWRGDKEEGLVGFKDAFVGLLGRQDAPSIAEMDDLAIYLNTVSEDPNPHRNLDNTETSVPRDGGRADLGKKLFMNDAMSPGQGCNHCHTLVEGGTNNLIQDLSGLNAITPREGIRVAPLTRAYLNDTNPGIEGSLSRVAFGVAHDGDRRLGGPADDQYIGSFIEDGLLGLIASPNTKQQYKSWTGSTEEPTNLQLMKDLRAFLLEFPNETEVAVGKQLTFASLGELSQSESGELATLLALAAEGRISLIISVRSGAEHKKFVALGGVFYSDAKETLTAAELMALATPETPITVVAREAKNLYSIIDRDDDNCPDETERQEGTDPLNANDVPEGCTLVD